jgi:predicted acetyltransferase
MNRVEVIPATEDQQPILGNLLELYAHDFSEFFPVELGKDGRFGYANLPLYWSEPGRHAFLIRLDGKLAGLVLVKKDSGYWDMAEFFVVRGYRRRGIGREAAEQVWRRFPGPWQVRVMDANRTALPFWLGAISSFAGEMVPASCVEDGGRKWHVFSFESFG